jgi:hypothetical protein
LAADHAARQRLRAGFFSLAQLSLAFPGVGYIGVDIHAVVGRLLNIELV